MHFEYHRIASSAKENFTILDFRFIPLHKIRTCIEKCLVVYKKLSQAHEGILLRSGNDLRLTLMQILGKFLALKCSVLVHWIEQKHTLNYC